MSIDLNWETLTSGPDGAALAETIRVFIHDRFQKVTLPRFIQAVNVHAFEFGQTAPEIELKDVCDPLPDFYEDMASEEDEEDSNDNRSSSSSGSLNDGRQPWSKGKEHQSATARDQRRHARMERSFPGMLPHLNAQPTAAHRLQSPAGTTDLGSPFLGVSTPGIPGGTSNLNYFHSHFATGLSGSQTPLAAVAGARLPQRWADQVEGNAPRTPEHHHSASASSVSRPSTAGSTTQPPGLRERESVSSVGTAAMGTRPHTRDGVTADEEAVADPEEDDDDEDDPSPPRRFREPRVEDLQTVFRVRYAGDVRLSLTALILLDYPMPSFVGIPVKLNITGVSFDGVAVLAYIRKRAHFCFLSPEDAYATLGPGEMTNPATVAGPAAASLLQEIKVESEIGKREQGKQVLKNVGKVEKFVLEQVRRIFEDEFVYPSFWTFLV